MNNALALKADQSSLNALTTTVNSKANTTDLDAKADVSSVYTQSEIATLLAGKVDTTSTLIQSENNEMIIPQRALPYPPKNISIPAGNYGGADDSPTAWAYPFDVVFPLTEVNGLNRKDYGHGTYELGNMAAPPNSWAELTLPLNVVATGVEAVQRSDGGNPQTNAYPSTSDGWKVYAWNASNSTWVEMNMDNSKIEPDENGTLPTTYREITGNTLSSNKYRVMLGEQRLATLFDGFRIYSKDESLPEINLHDLIESVVELNT